MKVIYRGPGDAVEMDGLSFARGDTHEVTANQYQRMRVSDPAAIVEVVATGGDEISILANQGRTRDKALRAVRQAEHEAALERDRVQAEADARAQKEAAEADARAERNAAERAKVRADAAKPISGKGA